MAQHPGQVSLRASHRVTTKLILRRVASANRANPERIQLLLKDDGDTYFRLYMFVGGELRNVAPAPDDGGYDRLWY